MVQGPRRSRLGAWWGEVYPGVVGYRVGGGEGYTGTHPQAIPGPIFSIYLALGPTYGQMKVILEVSEIGV